MGASCGLYGFLFFLPIILRKSFGYSQISSFCLTAPPAAFAIIVVVAISWIADKTRVRGPYAVLECIMGITGLAMTGFLKSATPRYVGTFLGVAGTTALIATSLAWGQNNIRSDARRNVATVVQIICAAVGGIYSALVFRQQVRLFSGIGVMGHGSLYGY
jgi:MFS transporter, ACS family, DAL5 transporter family protein